jgi:glycosyltransferase involved in cell wall biosynthesis
MEAMAAGLPVAAVDATGTQDALKHGVHGLLTENSSAALGNAVQRLLENVDLRAKYSLAARKRARNFGIRTLARKLLDVYDQATKDANAGNLVKCKK